MERSVVYGPDICDLQCMGNQSVDQDLTILSVLYHMHNAGLSGSLEVVRDDVNLGPIVHQGRYDFNHQKFKGDLRIKTLKKTDKIFSYCTWSTLHTPKSISTF